ncbi:MAG TPA: dihydroorotate dehydrogenase electron transfer subunit [Blastocatellia bacterium]|nr:dihydroorotate dehydrogenase electron transfer subunit [Blastocatellia bacterium]
MIDTVATVERNDLTASASSRSYGRLRLRLGENIPVLPGQFAMIKPRGVIEPLLRRAMAYYQCEQSGEASSVEFIYQILGRGTQALARMKPGDEVDLLGSLGNTYDTDAARGCEVLLVAGGAGSPALFMLAEELLKARVTTKLFIGGASRGDLCGLEDFTELLGGANVTGATIDGSYGEKGFVTAPLEKHLKDSAGGRVMIYSCGPDVMLHRVSQIAADYKVPAQVSLESPMACGFGICVGCAVAVKADVPEGFVYKKVCTDGPVFWSEHLKW